MADIMTLAP